MQLKYLQDQSIHITFIVALTLIDIGCSQWQPLTWNRKILCSVCVCGGLLSSRADIQKEQWLTLPSSWGLAETMSVNNACVHVCLRVTALISRPPWPCFGLKDRETRIEIPFLPLLPLRVAALALYSEHVVKWRMLKWLLSGEWNSSTLNYYIFPLLTYLLASLYLYFELMSNVWLKWFCTL